MSRARDIADGTLNSADINGGNIDSTTIGGTTPAAGTFTTFTSTGIDDNASSTALTIDSSGNVGIGTDSPGRKLEVQSDGGQIRVSDTDGSYGELFNNAGDFTIRSTGNGASATIDGIITFDVTSSGTTSEAMRIDSSGNLKFNSGYGSVATAYGCRAWVNFDGTGTVAIRASGNVSSITDNGTGDYTVNFTTAMPDINYGVSGFGFYGSGPGSYTILVGFRNESNYSSVAATSSVRVVTLGHDGSQINPEMVSVNIFR